MKRQLWFPGGLPRTLAVAAAFYLLAAGAPVMGAGAEANLVTAIQDVAKSNIPAVVHVEVTEKQQFVNPLLPFANDPFFRHFFNVPKNQKPVEREVKGLGSGILMDDKGYILTNSHVVGGATQINVVLSDGRRYAGDSVKVIGADPKTDLAVIRIIDHDSLPFARFGDSDKVEIGQWVVAIGHPQGLDQTVTQGIISAKHRRGIADPSSYQDFLQTDAAINPGNSGGPLLNLTGEVIGVNAAIVSQSGGFEGIGFAIPSNMALHVAKQIISKGKVERGWLGLTIQDLTPELARSLGLPKARGVLIANALKDGPADRAGIKQGDVIVQYDGKDLMDSADFRNKVATAPISQNITLTVLRDGKRLEIPVSVGSDQKQEQALLESIRERFGVTVKALGEKEAKKAHLDVAKGIMVTQVTPKGPFAKARIEAGDIILQVGDEQIENLEQFAAILGTAPHNKKIPLAIVDHRTGKGAIAQVVAP